MGTTMIEPRTESREELAGQVATMMMEARALILRRVATCEQCTELVIEMLGCAEVEALRSYVHEQIQCLVAN